MVPLNFMLKPDEMRFILNSSGTKSLAVGPDLLEVAREAAKRSSVERMISLPGEEASEPALGMTAFDALLAEDASAPETRVDGSDLAQIIYTSGTESLPKGAMLTHDAVIWQYVSCIIDGGMHVDDLVLHAMPFFHCAQLDVFLGPSVYLGATNFIMGMATPDGILKAIERHQITSFFAPPTVWIGILRSPAFDAERLGSLKKGYYGASVMPVEVLLEMQRRLPALRLWNFYGQTEIAPVATVLKPEDQVRKAGSAGRAALNVETRVVTPDMRDVEVGEIGEIVHRSPHLMSGYYNESEKTAAAFSGGWFPAAISGRSMRKATSRLSTA
jgi:fatty-acyl-CoA synthase